MTGYDEFIAVFGKITLFDIAQLLFAGVFLFLAYRKLKKYLVDKHDREQLRDAQLKEALDSVRKYPEYRQQSIRIQQELEEKIQAIRTEQAEQTQRLVKMEEDAKRRERSKLRDLLLQSYRYYTDKERNPLGAWTSMEAEAFWEQSGKNDSLFPSGFPVHADLRVSGGSRPHHREGLVAQRRKYRKR